MAFGKELGSKLSAVSFGWTSTAILEAVLKSKDKDVPLYRIWGGANGLRKYESTFEKEGFGFGLSGQFKGVGSDLAPDGSEKIGSVAYIPKYVHQMVEGALGMGDVEAVRIAFDIYARYDESLQGKYRYVAYDLINEGNPTVDAVEDALKDVPALSSVEVKKLK